VPWGFARPQIHPSTDSGGPSSPFPFRVVPSSVLPGWSCLGAAWVDGEEFLCEEKVLDGGWDGSTRSLPSDSRPVTQTTGVVYGLAVDAFEGELILDPNSISPAWYFWLSIHCLHRLRRSGTAVGG
jgi:hypothetical protein